MPTIELDGTTFNYEERGSGPTLLLVHGTGGHTGAFAELVELLAPSYRVITYDRRGFGGTTAKPPRPKQYLAQHTADAAGLLTQLDASGAIVVGWSWGAVLSLSLAIDRPDLVKGLVLYEPPLHVKKHMTPRIAAAIGGAIVLGKLGGHRLGATRFYRFALSRTDGSTAFDDLEQGVRDSLVANSRPTVAELQAGTGEELTSTAISAIACPAAVIVGGRSARFLGDAAGRVSGLLPSARVVRVPEGDHVMNIRQPGLLADAIRDCIDGWTRS